MLLVDPNKAHAPHGALVRGIDALWHRTVGPGAFPNVAAALEDQQGNYSLATAPKKEVNVSVIWWIVVPVDAAVVVHFVIGTHGGSMSKLAEPFRRSTSDEQDLIGADRPAVRLHERSASARAVAHEVAVLAVLSVVIRDARHVPHSTLGTDHVLLVRPNA